MIKTKDVNGNILKGIYKKPDGSIVVMNKAEFDKSKKQKETIDVLQTEVDTLKRQMTTILELLNGKH